MNRYLVSLLYLSLFFGFSLLLAQEKPGSARSPNKILDLAAQLQAGGTINLPAGRFELNEAVTISSDLRLAGAGKDNTLIAMKAAPVGISIEGNISVTIEGISFEYEGNSTADIMSIAGASFEINDTRFLGAIHIKPEEDDASIYGSGLYLLSNAQGSISNSEFISNQFDGLSVDETTVLELSSNLFRDNDTALGIYSEAQVNASNNHFFKNGVSDLTTVYLTGSATLNLEDNHFQDNFSYALLMNSESSLIASFNQFENNGDREERYATILMEGNARSTLSSNSFTGNPSIAMSARAQSNVTLTQNTFENNGDPEGFAALSFNDESTATIDSNVISNNPGGAVNVFGNATIALTGNQITANQTWVNIYASGSSSLNLTNNQITLSEGIGVYAKDNSELTLTGNTISQNSDMGIHLEGQSRAIITGNIFEGNRSGIALFEQSYANIEGNNLNANQNTGIGFLGESSGSATNNTISNHSRNGIVASDISAPSIENNTLTGNKHGILLNDQSIAIATNNTLNANEHGVYIVDGILTTVGNNVFENNVNDVTTGEEPTYE